MRQDKAFWPDACAAAPNRWSVAWRGAAMAAAASILVACGGDGDGDDSTAAPPPTAADRFPLIATPTVTGPVAQENFLSPTKNYTFYATDVALQSEGYVEEEFFVEGKANVYDAPTSAPAVPTTQNANVVRADVPYKTRIVVRRPTDPAKFNGTVVLEWLNVTDGFDGEYHWYQSKDYLIRQGYAWIGLSAQNNGIANASTGLKTFFSPTRYGSLDVTGGATVTGDQLSYDILSQTAKAAYAAPAVLNGLAAKNVIAVGMSQSGIRLGVYTNYVHMRAPIIDAFITQVWSPVIRDDFNAPLIKVLSESEATATNLQLAQADTKIRKTWWVAMTTHGDHWQRTGRAGVRLRDLGADKIPNDACGPDGLTPTRNRAPIRHPISAAVHHLKRQIESGTEPPSGAPFATVAGAPTTLARDANGNLIGGIRMAAAEVPTARAHGTECGNSGAWVPFTTEKLQSLYPTHQGYVAKVKAAVDASVAAGFVLPEDGAQTVAEAEASVIGRGLECGLLCLNQSHWKADYSSTGMLRDATVYYRVKNGQNLVQAVDDAHLYTAYGYSNTGGAKRLYFDLAAASLQRYINLVSEAQVDGRLTTTAASTLTLQANIITRGLQADAP